MKDYVARLQATDWYFWAAKYFLVGTKKKLSTVLFRSFSQLFDLRP